MRRRQNYAECLTTLLRALVGVQSSHRRGNLFQASRIDTTFLRSQTDTLAEPRIFGSECDTREIQKTATAEEPSFVIKSDTEIRADLSVEDGTYTINGFTNVRDDGSGSKTIRDATSLGAIDVNSSFTFVRAKFPTLRPLLSGRVCAMELPA